MLKENNTWDAKTYLIGKQENLLHNTKHLASEIVKKTWENCQI